jgi:hypothetical protein
MDRGTLVFILGVAILFVVGFVVPPIRNFLFAMRVLRAWNIKAPGWRGWFT